MDLIDRQAAIDALEAYAKKYNAYPIAVYDAVGVLQRVPSAQPEPHYDEWRDTCKEYDKEKHSCPRWNKVIKNTVDELKSAHPEQRIDADGTLWITVNDIEQVKRVIVDEEKSKFCRQFYMDAQPEPCEDAVSRKAAIDAIDNWKEACLDSGHKETVSDIKLIRKDFIDLPPVTPKQRTGYWIDDGSELGCQCSECGKSLDEYIHATECTTLIEIPKLCPNCGAKMKGGDA